MTDIKVDNVNKRINDALLQNLPNRGGDPDRPRILDMNRKLRDESLNTDIGEGLGYLALNIPVPDMRVLELRYPDLVSQDHEIRLKAWKKFIASPESEIYKIRKGDGKRKPANRIIVK